MYQRTVIKLGTSVLTDGANDLSRPRMLELVRQAAELHATGHDIIITSSGAVSVGRAYLNSPELFSANIVTRQLFAAVGQPRLMRMWEQFFDIYGIQVGQILLTRADVENRQRYLNARDAFSILLEHRIVPIVNENDAVATEEIKVGDNDNLSALVATLTNADLLLMLTDQPGLFTADPRVNPEAELIPEVHHIDDQLRANAGGTSTGLGVGGMATKLQAANIARHAGADVVICAGSEPNVITRVVGGEALGTRFPALETRLESRKRWILAGPRPAGELVVDAGAVSAISHQGRSLLPAGVTVVNGDFDRGDTISIRDGDGHELARGTVAYASDNLRRIMGSHSNDIVTLLGYTYGPAAVHRNNMILLAK